ncbi:MAG: formate dehydrogenase subunit alpha [Planctomycetota bacterium]|nr:formate dehydrogenase subunit alpha [Planctomycetota bacterium]
MDEFKLTVNGREITARRGETILAAALRHGIEVPHLCHDPRLVPTGACRLCLVEIKGQPGFHTSCTRPAEAGMVVETETEEISAMRRTVLELLLSEHRVSCTTCDSDGDCLLQDYAYRYGAREDRYPNVATRAVAKNYTEQNAAIEYDPSKCIRCQRCVRICAEVVGAEAITMRSRAMKTAVSTAFDMPLDASGCVTCGQCIGTCPTGALSDRTSKGAGRAKDLARVLTVCPYCGVGCRLYLNVDRRKNRVARVTSEAGLAPSDGNLCVKGRFGMDFVGSPDRLRRPLIKDGSGFREAGWDEALDFVASRLKAIRDACGPDAVGGLASAKCTNEENYLFQKFMRAVVGTNNVDHCARLCHASTVAGLAKAFGSGAMTNSIADIGQAGAIFVIGSNTTECHPVIGMKLMRAAACGVPLIVADPRRTDLAARAAVWLRHLPGTDVALLNAMARVIIGEGLVRRDFIERRTEGFEDVVKVVEPYTPEMAGRLTGVPPADIVKAARIYAGASAAAIFYSMGITQHTTGVDNVLAIANLAMLTGNIGRPGAGVNPLRGQNNVQGSCDMGALPNVLPGYQRVDDEAVRAKFEKAWGVRLPAAPGLTVVEMTNAAAEGKLRSLYVMGENPMLSDPDIGHVEEALKRLDLLVVQDIFLSETARLAHVVLPAASFAEKDGTFTNTERRVQRVRKAVEPPGEALADWEIICELSRRMGFSMTYAGPSAIMDEISSLTPIYGGIRYGRLEGDGLQWPCPDGKHPGTPILHVEKFSRGPGKFHAVEYIPAKELPDGEYPFLLTTGRMLEHFHTGTMTRRSAVLNWLVPGSAIEIGPEDAARLGIRNGDRVAVRSRRGRIETVAAVAEGIAPGVVFMTFHFGESPANRLTIAALDPVARIPELKVCAVRIERL